MNSHSWKAAALAIVVGLSLVGCSAGTTAVAPAPPESSTPNVTTGRFGGEQLAIGDPTEGGALTWGVWIPINSLDPAGVMGDSIVIAMKAIFDTLMVATPDGGVEPNLAESLTTNDNLIWELALDPSLTFTDGTPFNAEAVISHIEDIASESSTSVQAADARRISAIDSVDEYKVRFTLDRPNNQFGLLFAQNSMGMIPSPTAKAAAGADFATNPVGAGPFKLESFTPGVEVVLAKNEGYKFASEGRPHLDRVTLKTVPDESSRLAGVRAGDLDGATVASVPSVEEARSVGLTGLEQPVYSAFYMFLNHEQEQLADIRVRRAISEAIDRAAVNEVVYQGLHEPMEGFLVSSHPFAAADGEWPSMNIENSKKLVADHLAETGEGELEFTISIVPAGDNAVVAPLIQQMLAAVGIKAKIETVDQTSLVGKFAAADYDIALITRTFHAETTTVISDFFRSTSSRNWGRLNLAELDALLDQAGAAMTDGERTAVIPDILEVMADNVAIVPIVSTGAGRILGPRVAGFPDGDPTATSIEQIDLTRVWVHRD